MRNKAIALSKLLNRVKFQNNWNLPTFIDEAKKIENVSQSEAARFYAALIKQGYLVKGKSKKYSPVFDTKMWHDEDYRINLIKTILEDYPIVQKRGRVKGKFYPTAVIMVAKSNPLEKFTAKELVEELRNRGYKVSCQKEIVTVEEL